MQKKHAAGILLWIAVITLLAHDLIPHHDNGVEQFDINGISHIYLIPVEKAADPSGRGNGKPACCIMNQDFLMPCNHHISSLNSLSLQRFSLTFELAFYLLLSQFTVQEIPLFYPFPADSLPLLHSNLNLPHILRGPPVV